jgi:hypothetical protein
MRIKFKLTLSRRLPLQTVAYKLTVNLLKQVTLTPFKGFTGFLSSVGFEPDAETKRKLP